MPNDTSKYAYRKQQSRARAVAASQSAIWEQMWRISLMAIVTAAMVLVLAIGVARAQGAQSDTLPLATTERMQTVITAQIDAFLADDAEAAFAFAAEQIKTRFQTPGQFVSMVQQGYPAVYAPQSYSFAGSVLTPQGPAQQVEFVGEDGRVWRGFYTFDETSEGDLLISGVFLRQQNERQI